MVLRGNAYMKKIICGIVIGMLLVSVGYAAGYSAQQANFKVFVNGTEKSNWGDVPPLVVNGRTMLPLKAVGEALGVNVRWDGSNNCVIVGSEPIEQQNTSGAVMKVDGLEIRISGKIKGIPVDRAHEFTITNKSNNVIEFDPLDIGCNTGITVVIESKISGYDNLTKTKLQPNQTIKGILSFGNEQRATNRPTFMYKNAKMNVDD